MKYIQVIEYEGEPRHISMLLSMGLLDRVTKCTFMEPPVVVRELGRGPKYEGSSGAYSDWTDTEFVGWYTYDRGLK